MGDGKKEDSDGVLFYLTAEDVEKDTYLTSSTISLCGKFLESLGILRTKKKGLPMRKWFYVDMDRIENLLKNGNRYHRNAEISETNNLYEPHKARSMSPIKQGLCPSEDSNTTHTTYNHTTTSKDVNQTACGGEPRMVSPTFLSSEDSLDILPYEVLKSILDTGMFINTEWSATHPSKRLSELNETIQTLRNRTFLSGNRWKDDLSDKDIDLSATLPYDSGEESLVPWDSIVSMILHACQALREAWDKGFDYPKMLPHTGKRRKILIRDFLINDRDPSKCTSTFLTFLHSPLKSQLEGRWKETKAQLPKQIAEKMDALYHRMVYQRDQSPWSFQSLQIYYSAGLELVEWYRQFREGLMACSENQFPVVNLPSFFSLIIQYIEEENITGGVLKWEFLTPKSPYWQRFVNLARYEQKVELEPTADREATQLAKEEKAAVQRRREEISRKADELRKDAEECGIPTPPWDELMAMAEKALEKEKQWRDEDAELG